MSPSSWHRPFFACGQGLPRVLLGLPNRSDGTNRYCEPRVPGGEKAGMKAILQIINEMQADGIIGPYAIGGAAGASFYLEPAATFVLDVFVSLKSAPGSPLISLAPVYEYLTAPPSLGTIEKEAVILEGWAVRFRPPGDALEEEALAQAVETDVAGVKTRVLTAEHLVALALELGGARDETRITRFLESGVLDGDKLDPIIARHGLLAKWREFQDKHGNG